MPIAYWCVLAAVLAPYFLLYAADKPMLRSPAWRCGILCVITPCVDVAIDGRS
jgi:uncharacterized MAPEG superfamily protein